MILKPLRPEFFRTDMGDYVLSVRDLRVGRSAAAVGVDVRKATAAALVGPHASSALAAIAGSRRAAAGSVRYLGYEIVRRNRTRRVRNGIVLAAEPRPFRSMTVLENAMVGAFVRTRSTKKARAAALDALALLGLAERAGDPAVSLDTRGAVRLEVARALASRPLLLLIDGAFGGPDGPALTAAQLEAMFERGTTVLLAEADRSVLPDLVAVSTL